MVGLEAIGRQSDVPRQWVPDELEAALSLMYSMEVPQALKAHPAVELTACHIDFWAENLLLPHPAFAHNGEQLYVIDWEYSSNGDPMWDLAALSVESRLT